ncbi:hypothetical protein Q9189_006446 [Teloschistes chrysophthalmus]
MNETYNQHIRQLAPKYRQLLKTALIWTLLADGVVATVSEIMDVYSGIYLESNDSNFVSVSADDQKLLVAQLREVSGPFLEIRDGGMDHIVTLRDRIGIWETGFCLFLRRDLQLKLAIACLQHMNSRLFQRKFIPAALNQDPPKGLGTLSRSEPSSPLEDQPEDEEGKEVSGVSINQDRSGQPSEAKSEESGPAAENGLTQGTLPPIEDETEAKVDIDDDSSLDSEDMDLNGQEWQTLLAELDRFCISNTPAFAGWKQAYIPYYREEWKPLFFAASYGLTSLTELLLDSGADLSELTPDGKTPLYVASYASSRLDLLQLLLQKRADPNYEAGERSLSAFYEWVDQGGDYECVLAFLRHGASCLGLNSSGFNVIHHFALKGSDAKVLDLLLNNPEDEQNHADLHHIGCDGESPLHKLQSRVNIPLDLLKAVVACGADINMEDQNSDRPLYEAVVYGETEAIREIIEGVSDVDDDNVCGRTAIYIAACFAYLDTVKVLLDYGADIERKNYYSRTPLSFTWIEEEDCV